MANPVKYETHYEGGCSYAMGDRGEKVAVNPEIFKIVDGKLYLFIIPANTICSGAGIKMKRI